MAGYGISTICIVADGISTSSQNGIEYLVQDMREQQHSLLSCKPSSLFCHSSSRSFLIVQLQTVQLLASVLSVSTVILQQTHLHTPY